MFKGSLKQVRAPGFRAWGFYTVFFTRVPAALSCLLSPSLSLSLSIYICIGIYMHTYIHKAFHIHTGIYIYNVCVCTHVIPL